MSNTISVNSVGPVEDFEYELSEPGIHVILGDSGSGKTTILRTVELATGGKVEKPTKKDGAKSGVAVIGGKKLKIGKTIREEGELSLEGLADLDLASLHSPKFLSATTRDAHRIKALVRLAQVTPDVSMFHELLGTREQFDAIVDADAVATDDMVEMASKVKRAIEKAAQSEERQVETAKANLRSESEKFAGIDFDSPHDAKELQAIQVSAIERKAAVSQQRSDALKTIEAAAVAREKLDAANDGAVSVEDANEQVESAFALRSERAARVKELQQQLEQAQHELEIATGKLDSAQQRLKDAERHAELTKEWREQIEAAENVECPSQEDVQAAEKAVEEANVAIERGRVVRAAIAAKAEADRFSAQVKKHESAAKRLRSAAAATQDVLSSAIGKIPQCPLKVWNDDDGNVRLVMETDRSKTEPFDDLSDGERYDVLMPMLFRPDRIIVLSQAGFGELSPAIRERVHDGARAAGTFVLTAQADRGDLRAELYSPELEAAVV